MIRLSKALALLSLVFLVLTGAGTLLWAMPDRTTATPAPLGAPKAAAQLYAQGDYALSAQAYSQLIDQGYGDVALHFNRGLAYHQAGDTINALASLREAGKFAPRNAQIRAAVNAIEATAPSASLAHTGKRGGTMVSELTRWISPNELALVALGLWLILGGAATAEVLRRSLTNRTSPR
jgi:tetratricopeptide (TPR) repeat protein